MSLKENLARIAIAAGLSVTPGHAPPVPYGTSGEAAQVWSSERLNQAPFPTILLYETALNGLNNPAAIAMAGGSVITADTGNNRVLKLTTDGVITWRTEGAGDFALAKPSAVAVAKDGDIYVAESGNRIQQLSPDGHFRGQFGYDGMDSAGLAIGPDGLIYVSDKTTHQVLRFNMSGNFLDKIGKEGTGDGEFKSPSGLAFDAEGNLYVSDSGNHRIQKFAPDGTLIGQFGSIGTGEGQLITPRGIVIYDGKLYVADHGNDRIQVFNLDGTFLSMMSMKDQPSSPFAGPTGIAFDREGKMYVLKEKAGTVAVYGSAYPSNWRVEYYNNSNQEPFPEAVTHTEGMALPTLPKEISSNNFTAIMEGYITIREDRKYSFFTFGGGVEAQVYLIDANGTLKEVIDNWKRPPRGKGNSAQIGLQPGRYRVWVGFRSNPDLGPYSSPYFSWGNNQVLLPIMGVDVTGDSIKPEEPPVEPTETPDGNRAQPKGARPAATPTPRPRR